MCILLASILKSLRYFYWHYDLSKTEYLSLPISLCCCLFFVRVYLRVSDQNGVSLLYIMLEIYHSGWEPLICFLSNEYCCPFVRLAWQKLKRWTLHANCWIKCFHICHAYRRHWLLQILLSLTLTGVHKIRAKQSLLASFSRTLFISSVWNVMQWWSGLGWTSWHYIL